MSASARTRLLLVAMLVPLLMVGAGCGSSAGSAPSQEQTRLALVHALSDPFMAARILDPQLFAAKGYSLKELTASRFITEPAQRPGEPGYNAQVAVAGSYLVEWQQPDAAPKPTKQPLRADGLGPKAPSSGQPSAPPAGMGHTLAVVPSQATPPGPADPARAQIVAFRRVLPIRLERDGASAWRIP